MTQIHYRVGELCPLTPEPCCQRYLSTAAKTVATEAGGVMSRTCPRDRLLTRVTFTPTCWLWTGAFSTQFGKPTYGQFILEGDRIGAHKASHIIHNGPVPDGLDCMHSCDVKACVNPAHLSVGTRTQNLLDHYAANPDACAGENNGRARLTWDQVHAIRAAAAAGARTIDLAAQYEVAAMHITHIKVGRRWPESKCPVHGSVRTAAA